MPVITVLQFAFPVSQVLATVGAWGVSCLTTMLRAIHSDGPLLLDRDILTLLSSRGQGSGQGWVTVDLGHCIHLGKRRP